MRQNSYLLRQVFLIYIFVCGFAPALAQEGVKLRVPCGDETPVSTRVVVTQRFSNLVAGRIYLSAGSPIYAGGACFDLKVVSSDGSILKTQRLQITRMIPIDEEISEAFSIAAVNGNLCSDVIAERFLNPGRNDIYVKDSSGTLRPAPEMAAPTSSRMSNQEIINLIKSATNDQCRNKQVLNAFYGFFTSTVFPECIVVWKCPQRDYSDLAGGPIITVLFQYWNNKWQLPLWNSDFCPNGDNGVWSVADKNGDGLLDVYIGKSDSNGEWFSISNLRIEGKKLIETNINHPTQTLSPATKSRKRTNKL